MRILKQFFILGLLSSLSVIQIIYLYLNNNKLITFYPKWNLFVNNKVVSISTNQGFFAQISPLNQDYLIIRKQLNTLIISPNPKDKSNKNVVLTIKYCSNCFILDLKNNIIYSNKNQNEDIIMKKKIINNGYSIEKKNNIDLSKRDPKLVIFNAISEEILELDTNNTIVYFDDLKKEVRLEVPNSTSQKFTFL